MAVFLGIFETAKTNNKARMITCAERLGSNYKWVSQAWDMGWPGTLTHRQSLGKRVSGLRAGMEEVGGSQQRTAGKEDRKMKTEKATVDKTLFGIQYGSRIQLKERQAHKKPHGVHGDSRRGDELLLVRLVLRVGCGRKDGARTGGCRR